MTADISLPHSDAGRFAEAWHGVWARSTELGRAAVGTGDLSTREWRLVDLAPGAGSEGAVHPHVRHAQSVTGVSWVNAIVETQPGKE